MAYLSPHFVHDAFVSYSHGDPRSVDKPLKEWTLELVRKLEDDVRLDPDFKAVSIWRDSNLDPTSHLTATIKDDVKCSAILFIVMSKPYLESHWCRDELDWFREQIEDRRKHEPGRVFIIRAQPTDESNWPKFLRDERGFAPEGFRFHEQQSDMPYCWRGSRVSLDEYVKSLIALRSTFFEHLRKLQDSRKVRVTQAARRSTGGGTRRIYLHARAEDASICQEVRGCLLEEGFDSTVDPPAPGKELPDWNRESKIRIKRAKDCDALALIRTAADANFIDTLVDIGRFDREAIRGERGFPLPCAVLDRSGEELPIDVSRWDIERFDLLNGDWRLEFRQWMDQTEYQLGAVQP